MYELFGDPIFIMMHVQVTLPNHEFDVPYMGMKDTSNRT